MFKITFPLLVYICKTFITPKLVIVHLWDMCHTTQGQANYISDFSPNLYMERKAEFAFSD